MAIRKFNVSRDDSIYEAFPDLVQTKSGKLICVFNECEHHLDRTNARVMITESFDRGRSWSPKRPISEPGSRKAFLDCPRISLLSDGVPSSISGAETVKESILKDRKSCLSAESYRIRSRNCLPAEFFWRHILKQMNRRENSGSTSGIRMITERPGPTG